MTVEQVVVFNLLGATYGIDITRVREIITVPVITRIPRVPDYLKGVINLRGGVIPVIDLALRLGLAGDDQTRERIIVVEVDDYQVGLLVDSVSEVARIEADAVEQAAGLVHGLSEVVLHGIVKRGEQLILLLDVARVVDPETVIVAQAAEEPVAAAANGGN